MISFLIKHKKSILIITLFFFIGSIAYLGLSAYSRSNASLTAAQVGNQQISSRLFSATPKSDFIPLYEAVSKNGSLH